MTVAAVPVTPAVARMRLFAVVAAVAHVVFVLAWLLAGTWQGPRYSWLDHSISDMYAVGAPRGAFLVVVITLCGVSAILFAVLSVWPALKEAGWSAAVGSGALALSIYGLGDLLTPFERMACRSADVGCSDADKVANAGGFLDVALSTAGLTLFVAAGFFLSAAMGLAPGWKAWSRPTMWVTIVVLTLFILTVALGSVGLGGLFERLLAATGAAAIVVLAVGVLRHSRRGL